MFAEQQFKQIVLETLDRQGWTMPTKITDYVVNILIDKIDKNPWQPMPSYAEAYLTTTNLKALVELGNTCWFTRAVFPEIGTHRGIHSDYYVELGQGCYDRVLRYNKNPTIEQMRDHFEFIAEIAHTAVWSKGCWRSMWD